MGALFTSSAVLSFLKWLFYLGSVTQPCELLLCCEGDVGWQSKLLVFSPSNFSGPFLPYCRCFYTAWHANVLLCCFQHHTGFVATVEVLYSVLADGRRWFNQEAGPGGIF